MLTSLRTCIVLICILLFFTRCNQPKNIPTVKDGAIDLTNYDFEKSGIIPLNGTWEFYWQKLYDGQYFITQPNPTNASHIFLPRVWNNTENNGIKVPSIGHGTYRLKLKLPGKKLKLAIRLPKIGTAFRLFIDQKLVSETGKVGASKKEHTPDYKPQIVDFTNDDENVDIVFQVANYHYNFGGIWQPVRLGLEGQIRTEREQAVVTDFFLLGSIFIMALYHLGLFWIRRKSTSALYFCFICLLAALRLMVTNEYIIDTFIHLDWFTIIRLEYFSLSLPLLAFIWFLYSIFPKHFSKKMVWGIQIVLLILTAIVAVFPPLVFSKTLLLSQVIILLGGGYSIGVLIRAAVLKKEGARLLLLGFFVLFAAVVNDILHTRGVVNTDHQFATGLFVFIFTQALVLSFRFSRAFTESEELSGKLNYTNKNLEQIVEVRTNELQQSNQMLNQFVDELDTINHLLSVKNQDITDSIHYASNIQQALLPLKEDIAEALPEYFIFYKPLDIVSGDFYWFSQQTNEQTGAVEKIIFSVVDCTGHGVPGAFMSMLGMECLNSIVNQQKILTPSQILSNLYEHISQILHQRLNNLKDGMDLALCVIDLVQQEIAFAGANNPLVIIQNNELQMIQGNSMSMGGIQENINFEQHTFPLVDNTVLYLFTDGYQDQFGGKKNRKFMKKRLRELLFSIHQESMDTQEKILEQTIEEWMKSGSEQQIDDMLVAGLKLRV
ncbi:hypothetical protein BKI52_21525 [marine bacterium AO1-C]|nr:hypothetical protein BKI52_21525 [marine bacterium AO1-C]